MNAKDTNSWFAEESLCMLFDVLRSQDNGHWSLVVGLKRDDEHIVGKISVSQRFILRVPCWDDIPKRLSMKFDLKAKTSLTPEHILWAVFVSVCRFNTGNDTNTLAFSENATHHDKQKFIMLSSMKCPGATELTDNSSMMADNAMLSFPHAASSRLFVPEQWLILASPSRLSEVQMKTFVHFLFCCEKSHNWHHSSRQCVHFLPSTQTWAAVFEHWLAHCDFVWIVCGICFAQGHVRKTTRTGLFPTGSVVHVPSWPRHLQWILGFQSIRSVCLGELVLLHGDWLLCPPCQKRCWPETSLMVLHQQGRKSDFQVWSNTCQQMRQVSVWLSWSLCKVQCFLDKDAFLCNQKPPTNFCCRPWQHNDILLCFKNWSCQPFHQEVSVQCMHWKRSTMSSFLCSIMHKARACLSLLTLKDWTLSKPEWVMWCGSCFVHMSSTLMCHATARTMTTSFVISGFQWFDPVTFCDCNKMIHMWQWDALCPVVKMFTFYKKMKMSKLSKRKTSCFWRCGHQMDLILIQTGGSWHTSICQCHFHSLHWKNPFTKISKKILPKKP